MLEEEAQILGGSGRASNEKLWNDLESRFRIHLGRAFVLVVAGLVIFVQGVHSSGRGAMEGEKGLKHAERLRCELPAARQPQACRVDMLLQYLVGETMMEATWWSFRGSGSRKIRSTIGMRNAKVFPLPVTAWSSKPAFYRNKERAGPTSTTTSLLPMKRGIVDAWTGVMRLKPMAEETASTIHGDNGGFKPSHALEEPPDGLSMAGMA